MKLEKDGVTICGFVAIFILIVLIIAPPVLRGFFGSDEVNNSNTLLADVYEKMECKKLENYTTYNLDRVITTLYKNNEVNKITFSYNVSFLTNAATNNLTSIYIDEYSMLSQVTNASVIEKNDGFMVELDYEKYDYKYDQFLNKYSNNITSQKQYYTNIGYTCNIIK